MRARQQKLVTLGFGVVGIAVLAGAAFVLREPLAEQYYLWRLESGDEEERKLAAEKLGEIGSLKSIPTLIAIFRRAPEQTFLYMANMTTRRQHPVRGTITLPFDHHLSFNCCDALPIIGMNKTVVRFTTGTGRQRILN